MMSMYKGLRPRWRSEKVAQNFIDQMRCHALPHLGKLRVDQIGKRDLLNVLEHIWTTKPETARRVRRHVKAVLDWCTANDHVVENVCDSRLDGALPRHRAKRNHFASAPHPMVADVLRSVEVSGAALAAKLEIMWTMLTAARSGETRGERWSEIDLESRTWTVPAERMKAGVVYRVPLSDAAITVLERAKALRDGATCYSPPRLAEASRLAIWR